MFVFESIDSNDGSTALLSSLLFSPNWGWAQRGTLAQFDSMSGLQSDRRGARMEECGWTNVSIPWMEPIDASERNDWMVEWNGVEWASFVRGESSRLAQFVLPLGFPLRSHFVQRQDDRESKKSNKINNNQPEAKESAKNESDGSNGHCSCVCDNLTTAQCVCWCCGVWCIWCLMPVAWSLNAVRFGTILQFNLNMWEEGEQKRTKMRIGEKSNAMWMMLGWWEWEWEWNCSAARVQRE